MTGGRVTAGEPSDRRRALVGVGVLAAAWALLTALLAVAGTIVTHSASVGAFDRHVTAVVVAHRTDSLTSAMKAITWLGSWVALLVCLGLLAVLCVRRRLPVLVVGIVLVAWAGEASGVAIGKAVVDRQRPPERIWLTLAHGSSWPSGHTAVAVVLFGTLALATSEVVRLRSMRVLAWALAVLVIVAVGYSRIELGVHWCTDTLASMLFVTGWLATIVVMLRRALPSSLPALQTPQSQSGSDHDRPSDTRDAGRTR